MLIIQIALGIVLAVVILLFWREMTLAAIAIVSIAIVIILVCVGAYFFSSLFKGWNQEHFVLGIYLAGLVLASALSGLLVAKKITAYLKTKWDRDCDLNTWTVWISLTHFFVLLFSVAFLADHW